MAFLPKLHRARNTLPRLSPLLILVGCFIDLPAREKENAYQCERPDQCLDGYTCSTGYCTREVGCDNDCTNPPDCNDCLPPPGVCWEMCTDSDDCVAGWRCNDNRCVPCTHDEHCWALFTGWTPECTANNECAAGVCIDVLGEGYCAREAPCSTPEVATTFSSKELPVTSLTVCAIQSYTCADNACLATCLSHTDCPTLYHPTCAAGTCVCTSTNDCQVVGSEGTLCAGGQCMCANDSECRGTLSVCTDNGCTCHDDDECLHNAAGNRCLGYSPRCACETVTDCTGARQHPGTTWRCE